jgi:hypothetical protein
VGTLCLIKHSLHTHSKSLTKPAIAKLLIEMAKSDLLLDNIHNQLVNVLIPARAGVPIKYLQAYFKLVDWPYFVLPCCSHRYVTGRRLIPADYGCDSLHTLIGVCPSLALLLKQNVAHVSLCACSSNASVADIASIAQGRA